jgi:hypothetical protein
MRRLLLIFVALASAAGGPLVATAVATVPRITPGQSATAAVGTPVALAGTDLGTKVGKVFVGGKKAKVVTWTDTAITLVVPNTIPNGAVVVDLVDTGGTDSISGYLTVTGSSVPLGKNKAAGVIGRKPFRPRIHYIFFMGNDWQLQMKTGPGKHAKVLTFFIYGLTSIPGIYHGTEATPATLTYNDGKGTTYSGKPGAFTITITHHESNKFGGEISGVVTAADGRTLPIQRVLFIFDTGL